MLFTRIDRYVSVSFLTRALACALLIVLIYVSFDVLKRLDEVHSTAAASGFAMLAAYYSQVVPLFVLELVPGIVLVATGMVLVGMARSGELMALKACGASIHRVVAPVFFWTLIASVLAFAGREWLTPRMVQRERFLSHVLEDDTQQNLLLNDQQHSRRLYLREYDFARGLARDVSVLELRPDGTLGRVLQADSGRWEGGALRLRTVDVQEFDEADVPAAKSDLLPELTIETGVGRMDLLAAAEEGQEGPLMAQTLGQLRAGARTYPGVPYFRVAFHSRLASFFSPFILLMAGVPCLIGFERSVNSRFLSVILSIALAAGLYAMTFVFSSMGSTGTLNTALAGWLPAILGGSVGLWLFESMLT